MTEDEPEGLDENSWMVLMIDQMQEVMITGGETVLSENKVSPEEARDEKIIGRLMDLVDQVEIHTSDRVDKDRLKSRLSSLYQSVRQGLEILGDDDVRSDFLIQTKALTAETLWVGGVIGSGEFKNYLQYLIRENPDKLV